MDRIIKNLIRDRYLYLLALPGIAFFIVFKYYPMWGVLISFQDFSPYLGFFKSDWVGFAHFSRFFSNPDFIKLFRNTMAISLLNLVLFFPLPILLAIMMSELRNVVYQRIVQTIVYLPHFLSWVIIAGITFMLLSESTGVVNALLELLGFDKVGFMTTPEYFWLLLTGQVIWKEAGWGTIIFLAAISGVDPQLYEAAKMDGAGRFRQIWHITLPSIRHVIVVLLILRLGNVMDVGFEQVYLMMNGAVSNVADVFETYVYRVGIQNGQFSYSTAVGLFKSVIGLVLVVGSNRLAKRLGQEGVF